MTVITRRGDVWPVFGFILFNRYRDCSRIQPRQQNKESTLPHCLKPNCALCFRMARPQPALSQLLCPIFPRSCIQEHYGQLSLFASSRNYTAHRVQ